MKRIGFIYEKIISVENIRTAIWRASKGKRERGDVKKVLSDVEGHALRIHKMLASGTFEFTDYTIDEVCEGIKRKRRTIYKPKFCPDQIVHWAVILQLQPIFMRGMYGLNCGSIPGRGIHYGKRFMQKWIRDDTKNTKYFLQLDVAKFYPSIQIGIVKSKLASKIKDQRALGLIYGILDKSESGLPIGILTSQWLANFYLQEMDHCIANLPGVAHYLRYMDDMVLLGPNKRKLHKARGMIAVEMGKLGLTLKDNWQVSRVDDSGVDVMGFRFFRDRTILRRALMLRMTRKARRVKKKPSLHGAQAIISYMGWVKHSNSRGLWLKWLKPYIDIRRLKNIIRRYYYASTGNTGREAISS